MFYNVSKGIQLSAMFSLIIFLFLAIINAMNSLEQKWFPLNWYRSILVLTLISVLWLPHVFAKIGINDTFNGLIDVTILIIGMYVYIYFGKEDIESIIENSG